jgi:hypothetical protein
MAHIANSLEEGAMFWHERLGDSNMASLKELDAMVDGMNLKKCHHTTSHGGVRYFIIFIDDFSRKTHVYFVKAKGEAFEKFKQYKALVENEIGHKIKGLRFDNKGEFVSKIFYAFLAECGIQ